MYSCRSRQTWALSWRMYEGDTVWLVNVYLGGGEKSDWNDNPYCAVTEHDRKEGHASFHRKAGGTKLPASVTKAKRRPKERREAPPHRVSASCRSVSALPPVYIPRHLRADKTSTAFGWRESRLETPAGWRLIGRVCPSPASSSCWVPSSSIKPDNCGRVDITFVLFFFFLIH